MDTTCAQNSTLRIPMPASGRSARPTSLIASFAQKIGGVFCSLSINLGRKTTIVPGMSDKAIARLSKREHNKDIMDVMRWNALAHQYGGQRFRQ
jgi:hypothetical protein